MRKSPKPTIRTGVYLRWLPHTVAIIVLLSACSSLRDGTRGAWPEELPPESFFVAAYEKGTDNHAHQSLQEYLFWVQRFYEGTALYPNGWHDLSADVLASTPDSDLALEREQKLYTLGRDIAAEWSKDAQVNRVESSHLAVWGNAAGRAVEDNTVEETLQKISKDVQKLLSLELPPDAITEERYHPQQPDDEFSL